MICRRPPVTWNTEHVKIRERLGLLIRPAEEFEASAKAEQDAMLAMLARAGLS